MVFSHVVAMAISPCYEGINRYDTVLRLLIMYQNFSHGIAFSESFETIELDILTRFICENNRFHHILSFQHI